MIKTENVEFTYENTIEGAALSHVTIAIPKGQVVMLCGESGSGKTTYIRAINGLISHYYEGDISGEINVAGKDILKTQLHELAVDIGSVFQNPKSQFYTLLTDTEIVFGCENMGFDREDILQRFDKVVEDFHIEDLLGRNLFTLSGGEKQKIACASVGALMPKVLVLDEPSSNLDIKSILGLRKIIKTWKEKGHTILIAEHRLSWLKDVADRIIYFKDGKVAEDVTGEEFWKHSIEEMHQMGLRAQEAFTPRHEVENKDGQIIDVQKLSLTKKKKRILDIDSLQVPMGAVVAVLGNCGTGKTTFARCLCGLEKKTKGTVSIAGKKYDSKNRIKKSYMVMQDVNHQLFTSSVEEEVLLGISGEGEEAKEKKLVELLEEMDIQKYRDAHPMSLSGGQKQRVAIASALASDKEIIFYDEPTSGLDYRHMNEVSESIKKLSELGKTQFVITHDPELVERCCNYFIYMEDGSVKGSGSWNDKNTCLIRNFFYLG